MNEYVRRRDLERGVCSYVSPTTILNKNPNPFAVHFNHAQAACRAYHKNLLQTNPTNTSLTVNANPVTRSDRPRHAKMV